MSSDNKVLRRPKVIPKGSISSARHFSLCQSITGACGTRMPHISLLVLRNLFFRSGKHWYLAIITNPCRIFKVPSHTHNMVYSLHTGDHVGWAVKPLTELESNDSIVPLWVPNMIDSSLVNLLCRCLILIFDSLNHSHLRSRKQTCANNVKASDPAILLSDFLVSEAEDRNHGSRLYLPSGIQVEMSACFHHHQKRMAGRFTGTATTH